MLQAYDRKQVYLADYKSMIDSAITFRDGITGKVIGKGTLNI